MDFSQMPNDIIMNIIRMADGGLNTHKENFKKTLLVIKGARSFADEYIERYEDDYHEAIDLENDPETYYSEWEYAFAEYLDFGS